MEQAQRIEIMVGDQHVALPLPRSTVRAILEAAGIDPETHTLVEVRVDKQIEHDELELEIDIIAETRFEPKVRTYLIFVNGRERRIDKRILKFADLVALDPNPPPAGPDVEYTITFFDAVRPHKGTLNKEDEVVIKDGTRFNVRGTNRS